MGFLGVRALKEAERVAAERDHLRAYLFLERPEDEEEEEDLAAALRSAASSYEETFSGRVEVVVAPDLPRVTGPRAEAVAEAVGEALNNVGKHGGGAAVTVFVEPALAGGISCNVRDRGPGFDQSQIPEGVGLTKSIRERIAAVGGRADVVSRTGWGTEVRIWLPSA